MIIMMESGNKTKLMVMEYMYILMGQDTKGIGKMIIKMVMENNNGPTVVLMLEIINKVKSMVKDHINGPILVFIKDNG